MNTSYDVASLTSVLEDTFMAASREQSIENAKEVCRAARSLFAAMEEEVLWNHKTDDDWYPSAILALEASVNCLEEYDLELPDFLPKVVEDRLCRARSLSYDEVVSRLKAIA